MRSKSHYFFILMLLYSCRGPNVSNELKPTHFVDQYQTEWIFEKGKVFPNGTQFSIAIIEADTVGYYGFVRKLDTLRTHIDCLAAFEIGSISKVMTATILADFVLDQKVNLDDGINHYLRQPHMGNDYATFRRLANHTSGFPRLPPNHHYQDKTNPFRYYDQEKLLKGIVDQLKTIPVGEPSFSYSNFGAATLGYVLCVIDSTSYDRLLDTHILSKYRMHHTTTDRKRIQNQLVTGLDADGNPVSNWDLASLTPAGGVVSNVEDMAKFGIAHFNDSNEALTLTRKETASIEENRMIGLAWNILYRPSGAIWYAHTGGTGGYSSIMVLDVDRKKGVIILTNVSPDHEKKNNIMELAFNLMEGF